eukprot:CFRG4772T1
MVVNSIFMGSSAQCPSKVLLSVPNFNRVRVGKAMDIGKYFKAPYKGCFGMLRYNKHCTSDRRNRAYIRSDPGGSNNNVLEIKIKARTYGTSLKGAGGQFYTNQIADCKRQKDATFEYQVYFPSNFEWTHGGKLPGMHAGSMKCSGGYKTKGDCFSARMMWREDGAGEAYMYLPMTAQKASFYKLCANHRNKWSKTAACSLRRGSFRFKRGKWNRIKQYVKLNTPGKKNGVFKVWHNGRQVINENVAFRTSYKLRLGGIYFSTFFGGNTSKYAPKRDQKVYFKGFRLTAGYA